MAGVKEGSTTLKDQKQSKICMCVKRTFHYIVNYLRYISRKHENKQKNDWFEKANQLIFNHWVAFFGGFCSDKKHMTAFYHHIRRLEDNPSKFIRLITWEKIKRIKKDVPFIRHCIAPKYHYVRGTQRRATQIFLCFQYDLFKILWEI